MKAAALGFLVILGCASRLVHAGEGKEPPPGPSSGWMLNAGYFFKDTMFYGSGRGGLHAGFGRVFELNRHLGVWSEAGWFSAAGTIDTDGKEGGKYRAEFSSQLAYLVLGVSVFRLSVPIGVGIHWHDTTFSASGLTGPFAGANFTGRESGVGTGLMVNVYVSLPGREGENSSRRARLVLGYGGFIDWTPVEMRAESSAVVIERKWRPFRGEALRAGVEFFL